jgi:hypothetical protein
MALHAGAMPDYTGDSQRHEFLTEGYPYFAIIKPDPDRH